MSGIRNLNGQMLETTTRMTFKTEDYVDRIQPRLLLVTPQDNASGVAIDTSIELTFSEPILSESLAVVKLPDIKANDITINVKPYWVGEYSNFWITRSGATPRKVKNMEFAHDIVIV